ncbi:hypothetical protein ZWY2020_045206 [Hordeum vulgare]|nr:hypothetical protein ZWY2020_045206 [Hordeum vulgare]
MSFAGVSVVAGCKLLQPYAESDMIYSGAANGSWYHLLVVEGYSRAKHTPHGVFIRGRSFTAGGYRWAINFYPNGVLRDPPGVISVYLVLDQDVAQPVKDLERSKHLKNDCFTIRCDFAIAESAGAPFVAVPASNICQQLNHLFVTKVGADVMFEVGDEEFAAHRCVLAARSAVFMAELFGPMKEGTTTSAIQIRDMEPNVFNALLRFIYTDAMPEMMKVGLGGEARAEVRELRHLLAAADRYDLQRLKLMCEERLCGHIDVTTVAAILSLAAQHHCCGLKEACLEFLKVQSAADLRGVMAASDWEHIAAIDLSVVNELIAKLASKV